MQRKFPEQTVLLISIIKWVFLATVVGIIVGLSTTVFLKLLNWSRLYSNNYPYYFLLLPLALFLSAAIIKYLALEAEGPGTEKVIEAIHKRSGKIKAMVIPVKLVSTIITLAAGGLVGKEGPCAKLALKTLSNQLIGLSISGSKPAIPAITKVCKVKILLCFVT